MKRSGSGIIEANRKMLVVEFLWSLVSIAVSWTLGRTLVICLTATTDEIIVSNALLNLRMSTVCFFPLGVLFILRYSMQAIGHKVLPVLSSTIELVVKVISAVSLSEYRPIECIDVVHYLILVNRCDGQDEENPKTSANLDNFCAIW